MPHIDPSTIRLVDGFKIRQTLDPDFAAMHCRSTDIHEYYMPKYYIPEGEWWLDARLKEEKDFFIQAEEIHRARKIKTGHAFRKYLKQKLCLKGPVPNFVVKKHWGFRYQVLLVEGKIIRQYIDPEFTQGGHDLVYSYVPKGEIWIEHSMDPHEVQFCLHHELTERKMMLKGKSYDVAHEYGTAAEKEMRRVHGGFYPLDDNYPWYKLTDEQIRKKYYVGKG